MHQTDYQFAEDVEEFNFKALKESRKKLKRDEKQPSTNNLPSLDSN